jgi:uncharacterized repeat protein (TIGR01451 family)/CSLREA domain-containing protein
MVFPATAQAASSVFTVNSAGDAPDASIGNGACATGGTIGSGAPECTLRAAIQESNASIGDKDTIEFEIPGGVLTIAPATLLPAISDPVVIDATTQTGWVGDPIVEIRGPGNWGLKITGGDTTVRGLVVDRFHNEIVIDGAGGNVIAGNFIGTNVSGTQDGGGAGTNDQQIVIFSGAGNVIGGTSAADRNVVAGTAPTQISLRSSDNVVQGNFIGTNAAGTAAIPNGPGNTGVHVDGAGATGNLIGGTTAGAGNLISGNTSGIVIQGAETVVQGNRIGTDATGTNAIPNVNGIEVGGDDVQIGGVDPLARNVISGNTNFGIVSDGERGTIQGNLVGPDISGTKTPGNSDDPGNGSHGMLICGPRNLIGGTDSLARNIISGNGGSGVGLCNFNATQNHIEGNFIGVDVNGDPMGNAGSGVSCCLIGSVANVIGGTQPGAGNVIAYNGAFGVQIANNSGNAASILGNSIHSNGFIGIDLGHAAPGAFATENDPFDVDTGPNGVQNYPVLDWTSTGNPTTVSGTLNSAPNSRYRIEFFHNDACDTYENGQLAGGHLGRFGEGETYLGAIDVDTDANGNASFSASYPLSTDVTDVITSTATAADGSTSEFSECRADLEITKSDDPDPVAEGGTLTYTIEVANQGPSPALEVVVDDQLPGSGAFVLDAIVSSQGTCAPFFGPYRCELGDIPRFGTASITITGTVTASAGTSFTNTAMVDSELRDPDPNDNTATAETTVVESRPTGTIVIRKVTLPAGSPQSFSFNTSYDATGFSLSDGQSNTSAPLAPGTYSVGETAVPGWDVSVSCDDGSVPATIGVDAGETVTCTFTNTKRGTVTLTKTTNGNIDPARDITFVLTGPSLPVGGLTRSTFGDMDGVLAFGSTNLIPSQTYRMCESPVPAGFTSFWKLDGVIVTPFNPDATLVPPEDLGTRCYEFRVSPGQTRAFVVDNSRPGGDPRTIGYWKNWNRCTSGNQASVAQKNGGAAGGFFLVEDLLPQPVGDLNVTTCQQAVKLLSKQDGNGKSKSSDAAYQLAAQLLAARLNLAAGAETCASVQQAVLDGQSLLDGVNFTGSGDYLGSKSKDPRRGQALTLAATLDRYNNGAFC